MKGTSTAKSMIRRGDREQNRDIILFYWGVICIVRTPHDYDVLYGPKGKVGRNLLKQTGKVLACRIFVPA